MKRMATFAVALVALSMTTPASAQEAPTCDRACLINLTQAYVAGIEGNSTSGIAFAEGAKVVENI